MKTLHVNLYAAPGHGKSYVAERVSSELRLKGFSVELVREYAKELHWQGRLGSTEQLLISTEQYRRQAEMDGKVDVVISDCALPLGLLHTPDSYRFHLSAIMQTLTSSWNQLHVLVERDVSKAYSEQGRKEKVAEAQDLQVKVRDLLVSLVGGDFTLLDLDNQSMDSLVSTIVGRVSEKKAA